MVDQVLLFPYYCALAIRNRLYDKGAIKSVRAAVPTICIGNIAVGGTGKTPHTDAVLGILAGSTNRKNRSIALLSRGYGRKSKGFRTVEQNGSAALCGDEPLMLKKKWPSVSVAVDRNRIEGCRKLCEQNPSVGLIVLDDAFQYRKLAADLNIVLTDYNHPHWKDHLMPLGRLRDLPRRLYDADIIVVTKCPELEESDKCRFVLNLGLKEYNSEDCTAVTNTGRKALVVFTGIGYEKLEPVFDSADPRYTYSQKAVVFTGIAGDKALCTYLSDRFKIVDHLKFPDHHRYSSADIRSIMDAVGKNPTACILTTEKDAQRILDCKAVPQKIKERLFSVPISVVFLSETERINFSSRISSL